MSEPSSPIEQAATDAAAGLAGLLDLVERLGDTLVPAVVGYRATVERAGFSPEAAEQMAVALHAALIAGAFTGSDDDEA